MKAKEYSNIWLFATFAFCGLLFLLQIALIKNAPWSGDYWEHKAILRELSIHPFHPENPILDVPVPHAFFSPYMVLLGFITYTTGFSIDFILNIMMIINLSLFLIAIYRLTKLFIVQSEATLKAFLLLLLLILFFWGLKAPLFSSFFHFRSLILTLAYPSTFAFSCSIFVASVTEKIICFPNKTKKQIILYILVVLLLSIIILCHPLTFILAVCLVLYVFLINLQQQSINKDSLYKNILLIFFSVILALLLAGLWPYYSFYSLLKYAGEDNKFHLDSFELYNNILWKIIPIILLPVHLLFTRNGFVVKEWAWLTVLSILFTLYALGYYTNLYGFGRMIAFIVILCDLLLVKRLIQSNKSNKIWYILIFLLALPYLHQSKKEFSNYLTTNKQSIPDSITFQKLSHSETANELSFLGPLFKDRSAVILTDIQTGLFVPSYGGKLVATIYPIYWVNDAEERRKQVIHFFSQKATRKEREYLIMKYHPDYILLTPATLYLKPQLMPLIHPRPVISTNGINMFRIKK